MIALHACDDAIDVVFPEFIRRYATVAPADRQADRRIAAGLLASDGISTGRGG